jgi:hypothetical protein
MLPIGAYAPRWFMQTMHMDPQEAVQAACDVGARVMVPMHWGTFWLSREPALNRSSAAGLPGPPPGEIARTCGTSRWAEPLVHSAWRGSSLTGAVLMLPSSTR